MWSYQLQAWQLSRRVDVFHTPTLLLNGAGFEYMQWATNDNCTHKRSDPHKLDVVVQIAITISLTVSMLLCLLLLPRYILRRQSRIFIRQSTSCTKSHYWWIPIYGLILIPDIDTSYRQLITLNMSGKMRSRVEQRQTRSIRVPRIGNEFDCCTRVIHYKKKGYNNHNDNNVSSSPQNIPPYSFWVTLGHGYILSTAIGSVFWKLTLWLYPILWDSVRKEFLFRFRWNWPHQLLSNYLWYDLSYQFICVPSSTILCLCTSTDIFDSNIMYHNDRCCTIYNRASCWTYYPAIGIKRDNDYTTAHW